MLARGAACDTCRARKVKCDATRPFCSPCLKSARGNTTVAASKCAYEGTSVAIATANRQAEIQANGGVKRKRRQTKAMKEAAANAAEQDGDSGGDGQANKKAKASRQDDRDSRASSRSLNDEDSFSQSASSHPSSQPPALQSHLPLPLRPVPSSAHPSSNSYHAPHPLMPYDRSQPPPASQPDSPNAAPHPPPSAAPWQPTRSYDAPPQPTRYTLPPYAQSVRRPDSEAHDPAEIKSEGKDVEQLTDRVAELERQLKQQADTQAATALSSARQPPPAPIAGHPQHSSLSSSYGSSSAPGARSPSFPYATYSSYAPPLPPTSYGTSYPAPSSSTANGAYSSPSSSAVPNPLSYPPPPSNSHQGQNQYPPIQLAPPSNLTGSPSQYGHPSALPPHLSQPFPLDQRRRSLSTLSAIAGAVGMDDYPPSARGTNGSSPSHGGGSGPSPLSSWPHHHQPHESGGYRFTTSSPVSSTRHLGMSEPQAFALTSSPGGRTNWNATTSSLRTEMNHPDPTPPPPPSQPPQQTTLHQSSHSSYHVESRGPTPPHGTSLGDSSSTHSNSNATSPSTVPSSTKTVPSDPLHPGSTVSLENGSAPLLFEPFDLGTSVFPLLDLSYPASLPPLSVLHHLVSVFFRRAAVPSKMLSKAKILFGLSLSPTDPRWPDEALLHAICAYGCTFVSEESLGGGEYGGLGFDGLAGAGAMGGGGGGADGGVGIGGFRMKYWEMEGDSSAKEYHYRRAKVAIEEALSLTRGRRVGRNLFQVLQAVVLVCYVAYLSAQFSDLWLLAGTATRLIAPLGLNHLEPWNFDRNKSGPAFQDWGMRVRKAERAELLGPVESLEEHWERSATFWMAFAVDRFASANTDWTTSIDEKDISTHLPCSSTVPMPCLSIDPELACIPALSLASPSFLGDTTAPIGSLGLYIKATILLGRVVNYTQRFPRYLRIPPGETCSKIKKTMKATPEFIELDLGISKFKASHSSNFYDHAETGIDGFLASAYAIPHVATILLHETLTDRYDRTPNSSIQRCLASAKCIIKSTYVLYQSSYDLGGVDPFLPFCWSVAGRALVRDYATRRYWGQQEEAEQAKQLAEHCLSFTQHCAKSGSKIAQRLTETLEKHLENPDSLLPLDAGCGVVFDLADQVSAEAHGMTEDERKREMAGSY
ncbi:hypothetical protein JCM10212_000906 [Sporobolomyces blumeae]